MEQKSTPIIDWLVEFRLLVFYLRSLKILDRNLNLKKHPTLNDLNLEETFSHHPFRM